MKFIVSTIILTAVTVGLLWLMWRSWRRRVSRDAAIGQDPRLLAGTELETFDRVFYVATTPIDAHLERLAVPGLSFRGWSRVRVLSDGVEITVTGEHPVTISAGDVAGASDAQLTIDKVVERDGLSVLEWSAARGMLASTFRFGTPDEHTRFAASIDEMLRGQPRSATSPVTKETP